VSATNQARTRPSKCQVRAILVLLLLLPQVVTVRASTSEVSLGSPSVQPASAPSVTLRSATRATMEFKTHNDRTVDGLPSRTATIPHLVLHRNGSLTAPDERTLIVEVNGIEVPSGGVTVTLTVATEHVDPDADAGSAEAITVWHEARHIAWEEGSSETGTLMVFTRTFSATVFVDGNEVPTPTDYFGYVITVTSASGDRDTALFTLAGEHAFLMENQVVARLPQVREESEGAAPDELVVYYCDMVPFQGGRDSTRLRRSEVSRFVESELALLMVEAFRAQTDDWGFTWHGAWTSYRPEAGEGHLSVALTDGRTWYHGWAPDTGHAGISINVSREDNSHYESLADAIMGTFHHELFHNLQRSIDQSTGGDGQVDGLNGAWQWFSEGTAVLASSVGQPAVQFTESSGVRYHMLSSNRFFLLNLKSRQAMAASGAVVYWRFLYEHCGGMSEGVEDPGAGMHIIRSALAALYSNDIVDISSATHVTRGISQVMDQAIANTSSCPFETYEESLNHFARAVYALRLAGGRCSTPGSPEGCGFYDPEELYTTAQPQAVLYRGLERRHSSVIYSSHGMDFLDVLLHRLADGQSLVLEVEGAADGRAEFSVQVWRLVGGELGSRPRPVPGQTNGPELVGMVNSGGRLVYTIPSIDVAEFNRLAIIITRVDANEATDPLGEYTIRLTPTL